MGLLLKLSTNRWVCLGVAIRILLVYFGHSRLLADRPEISSPISSLTRLREGAALANSGLSPYTGSAFHAPPLLVPSIGALLSAGDLGLMVFVLADMSTAYILASTAALLPHIAGVKVSPSSWCECSLSHAQFCGSLEYEVGDQTRGHAHFRCLRLLRYCHLVRGQFGHIVHELCCSFSDCGETKKFFPLGLNLKSGIHLQTSSIISQLTSFILWRHVLCAFLWNHFSALCALLNLNLLNLCFSDPQLVAVLYLLNPLSILPCAGGSLGVLETLFVCLAAYGAVAMKPALSAFAISVAGYLGLHPLLLTVHALTVQQDWICKQFCL